MHYDVFSVDSIRADALYCRDSGLICRLAMLWDYVDFYDRLYLLARSFERYEFDA